MKIGKLKKVNLRQLWKHEATDLTCWLENNIEDLSEFINLSLEVIEREKKVGSFSIDLYAQTPDGEKVIIENQLEKTDHSHLGQIITYATNLEASYIVWVAKEIRPEHLNAVNWLNENTNKNFYLIQIEAFQIGDSAPAPYFKIMCQPDEDMKAIGNEKKEFTEREKFNIDFWEGMMKKCSGKLDHFCNKKASKYHFHSGSAGKGGFLFSFLATSKYVGVELYIDSGDSDTNLSHLNEIMVNKDHIESALKSKLIWDSIPGKRACRIKLILSNESVMNFDKNLIQEDLINKMTEFEKVLRPQVRAMNKTRKAA